MPFQSEKQRRYLWANEPEIARDWADTYGSRIEKNDGGSMRTGFYVGGSHHAGSTTDVGDTRQGDTDRLNKRRAIKAEVRKQQIEKEPDVKEKEKESFSKKLQRKAITWDLKKRLQKKLKSPTYDPEAAAYGIFDEDTETLQDRIDKANLPSTHPENYSQKTYMKDYPGIGGIFKGPNDRGNQALPNYYAPRDVHPGTGGDTTTEPEYSFNTDFQDSLTSAATTPDYYAGENPLASNLEWGKKMGVDPRTMGLTSFAANGGRIPRAFGGIMDTATGRRAYGLGSIFKSITRAAKKVLKSPVGKAAIMYGVGFGIPGTSFGGLFGRGTTAGMLPDSWKNKLLMKQLTKKTATDAATYGLDWGKAAIWGSSLLPWMLPGPEEDDEGDKGSNYDVLKNKYAQELMNIKRGAQAGTLDPNKFVYQTAKDGGRAGYYAGGQSTPSDYTMEDAMMTTTQDKLGGITDVMKQADLYRQGSVGQFYAENGGPAKIGADNVSDLMVRVQELQDEGLDFNAAMVQAMKELSKGKAQGGRIGAEEGGLMDLGGMEKDYRNDGGFVPLGGEEKADDVPARLSKNEFVFTADAVRGAGGGDIDKGAEIMENIMNNLEQGGQISEETQGLSGAQEMFDVSERLSEVV